MTQPSGATPPDLRWLNAAIDLSRRSPQSTNRYAVGALVVADGSVLATGYTGETDPAVHAEEVALAKLAGRRGRDLSRATVYSSLEPCTARKSRPLTCADVILAAGVRRVVFAMREPLLFADCRGVEVLRQGGVEVVEVPELAHLVGEINSPVLSPQATRI